MSEDSSAIMEIAKGVAQNAAKEIQQERSLAMDILETLKVTTRRLWWALFIVITLWAATIAGFLIYLNQYDFISYEQTGEGYNNINTGVEGSVYNNNGSEAENAN